MYTMKFFTKTLFDGEYDELAHIQLQKYSRGEFKYKAMVNAKHSKGKFSISTTPEYANELVRYLAIKLGDASCHVVGIIVSTRDLSGELDFQDKKQFMGVKQYILNRDFTGNELLDLCNKLQNSFIGLSFSVGNTELKIKPKSPKSAKPSTKREEKPKVDFCKVKTNDLELVHALLFDIKTSFKIAEVSHTIIINEVIITNEMKKIAGDNFGQLRKMAKKKGILIRTLDVDGQVFIEEKKF